MKPRVIHWDGRRIPQELRDLPPGSYAVQPVDELPPLPEEEETGILISLDQLDAGRGMSLVDVMQEIRRGSSGR